MFSLVLSIATRFLLPLLLMFSVFLLLRGHNMPGGGFSAGLVGGIALALYLFGLDLAALRRLIPASPVTVLGAGLLVALLSGILPLLAGDAFLTGQWFPEELTLLDGFHLGTPFVFDVGVFMVAAGAILLVIVTLEEDS